MREIITFLLSGVCHQIPEQCITLAGSPLFLCYRCTGMFLGLAITLILLAIIEPKARTWPQRNIIVALVILASVWLFDGINSTLYTINDSWALYPPRNSLRLYSGASMGFVLGTMLYPAIRILCKGETSTHPVLKPWWHGVVVLSVIALVSTAFFYHKPDNLVFWQIITATIVIGTISLINILLIASLKTRQSAQVWSVKNVTEGISFALLEMTSLAIIRSIIMGV